MIIENQTQHGDGREVALPKGERVDSLGRSAVQRLNRGEKGTGEEATMTQAAIDDVDMLVGKVHTAFQAKPQATNCPLLALCLAF